LEDNFDRDVEEMLCFFNAESEFYPCFDQTLREMVLRRFPIPTYSPATCTDHKAQSAVRTLTRHSVS
jgi:hypothetical protein